MCVGAVEQVSAWAGCFLQANFNWFCVFLKVPQMSFFSKLGCDNAVLCA